MIELASFGFCFGLMAGIDYVKTGIRKDEADG